MIHRKSLEVGYVTLIGPRGGVSPLDLGKDPLYQPLLHFTGERFAELDVLGSNFDRDIIGRVVHVHAALNATAAPIIGFYAMASSFTPGWLALKPVGDCEHADAIGAASPLGRLFPHVDAGSFPDTAAGR